MVDLVPKEKSEQKLPQAPQAPQVEEKVSVPIEVTSLNNGIDIKIEGDFVTLRLTQGIAEHIGQFRACSWVECVFKVGQAPDITAYTERDERGVR